MRRIAALAIAALLLGGALPATAEGEECVVGPNDRLVQLGTSTGAVATPQTALYSASTFKTLVLSLPQDTPEVDAPETASLDINLKWDSVASDFDLVAIGPDGEEQSSANINQLDGTGETVSVVEVAHCDSVSVEVQNFLGSPVEALSLEVVAS